MAYIIYNNDRTTILANIANGDVDNRTTSLTLIGKNVDNYGEYFNNNLVKILTNFSSNTPPNSPQKGQLWFNATTKRLNVYDGSSFNPTYGATVSGTASITTSTGDLWFDTINSQLKIWNGNTYKLVGPTVSSRFGKFGIEPAPVSIREFNTNLPQNVGILYSYGGSVGLVTSSSFLMSAANGAQYLDNGTTSTVVQGMTLPDNLDVRGTFYIGGFRQMPSIKILTAYFNIDAYGNPADPTTATAKLNIAAGNIAISSFLPLIFSTVTNILRNETSYPTGSEARVVCQYGSTASVRRFQLIYDPIHLGTRIWRWYDTYYNASLSTMTNIVVI